jgi:hypothetical protein
MSIESIAQLHEQRRQLEQEIALLRQVHESARSFMRFNGIDGVRMAEALRDMDEAVEAVKEFDGGTLEEFVLPRFPISEKQLDEMWAAEDCCDSHDAAVRFARLVEKYHGIVPNTDEKPSLEYVGEGMYKHETIAQAAKAWGERCESRGEGILASFLKYRVAPFAEQHEANLTTQFHWRLYMLCDAYESGIGHGIKRDGFDNADGTLYGENLECNLTYRIGYKQGDRRRDWEERKEMRETPKPFKSQWGKWFPTTVLLQPMREYAPGKWETAQWPSEAEKPTAQEILDWLHSPGSYLADGVEYGIYRIRWQNNGTGSIAHVEHTLADFSDIKRAMKASTSPPQVA